MLGIHAAWWNEIFTLITNALQFYFRKIFQVHYHTHRYLLAGTFQLKSPRRLYSPLFADTLYYRAVQVPIKIFYTKCTLQQIGFSCT